MSTISRMNKNPEFFLRKFEEIEAPFLHLSQKGEKEIRTQDSLLYAKTDVIGGRQEATEEGLTRLLKYMSGKNMKSQSMTVKAPYFIEEMGERIPKHSPILLDRDRVGWSVSILLPENELQADVPRPFDDRIQILRAPETKIAVMSSSGVKPGLFTEGSQELVDWVKNHTFYHVASIPRFAQYHPPFSTPIFKNDEIHVSLHTTH